MLEPVHPTPVDSAGDAGSYTVAETKAMQRAVLRLFDHWDVSDADAAIILAASPRRR